MESFFLLILSPDTHQFMAEIPPCNKLCFFCRCRYNKAFTGKQDFLLTLPLDFNGTAMIFSTK